MITINEIKGKIKAYYIGNDIDKVLDYITNLQQENKQLKEKIDKAIEYIKSLQKSEVIKLNRKEETFKDISKQQVAKNELVLSMIKSNKLLEILGDKE